MIEKTICLLGISGSPREEATDFVIRNALSYASEKYRIETDYFSLREKKINFCIHCDYCIREKKGCIHKDDMVEAYRKIEAANALLIGTPVYNGSISGQLKTFMDRCRALIAENPKAFKNKVGAGVAVGGDRAGGQELALITIHSFYQASNVICTGGGPFGSNLGGTVWSQDLGREGARKDKEGLKTVQKTVDRLITLTEKRKLNLR
jgi:multimeric flavodoxin WrbA